MRSSTVSEWLFRRLYQVMSGYDHPAQVRAEDNASLVRRLRLIDDEVPPRSKREDRHKDHKEWYCANRYLVALAAAEQLTYPLTVRKTQSPDFLLEWPDGSITGLEITEATTPAYQRELTVTEGQPGPHHVGPDSGWGGDEVERGLAALAIDAVRKKAKKIATHRTWSTADRHDVLLYNNGPYIGINFDPFVMRLKEEWQRHPELDTTGNPWPKGPLGTVSLLTGGGPGVPGTLLFDLAGDCELLSVPWGS